MKSSPKRMGSPGKVGQVVGKKGKTSLPQTTNLQKLDRVTVGSAIGILNKHFK